MTIKDIAKRLGLSHTTVSRALNDHAQTSDRTKALVRGMATDLGYVPNVTAQIMRGAASRLIGLVVPMVRTELYGSVTTDLAEKCRAAAYHLVLAITEDDADTELSQVQTLIDARAAGIIITPSAAPHRRTIELLRTVPTIQMNRFHPKVRADAVIFDDAAGTRAATDHLLALGHRRIAFVGGRGDLSTGAGRLAGFLAAHRAAGLEVGSNLIHQGPSLRHFGYAAMTAIGSEKAMPTAVVFGAAQLTTGGLEALHASTLRIPHDISVVGYSDPSWFHLVRPALTTIALPVGAMAETAASLLWARIAGARAATTGTSRRTVRVPLAPELIVRESTAPPGQPVRLRLAHVTP